MAGAWKWALGLSALAFLVQFTEAVPVLGAFPATIDLVVSASLAFLALSNI